MDRLADLAELATMTRFELENAVRARVQTAYLGRGKVLARVLGGYKLFLSSDDLGFSCHVMLDGFWEGWLTLFLLQHVKPGMTVIDVGANFGYYTLLFGGAVGPTGRVLAIEPVPSTAALLVDSVTLNGLGATTRVITAAAGAVPASHANILVPPREPKNAAVVAAATEGAIVVPSVTIDELTADLARVDLVKIDVEGAEIDVIAGMSETIVKHHPLIVLEFNAARYADPAEFLKSLLSRYAKVGQLDWEGNLKKTDMAAILADRSGEDLLLVFRS